MTGDGDSADVSGAARGAGGGACDEGGDPACLLSRVCPECGLFLESEPPAVCERCGAAVPADESGVG